MKLKRTGSATWFGEFALGYGTLSLPSGALRDGFYNAASRFAQRSGSNPEELVATAHAGCFNMMMSLVLQEARLTARELHTLATITLDERFDNFGISAVHLSVSADVPNVDAAVFRRLAERARSKCPMTRLLHVPVTLDVTLSSEWGRPSKGAAMAL